MDIESFRRDALDLAARRSLEWLRDIDPTRVRQVVGESLGSRAGGFPTGIAIGAVALGAVVGAGIALFATPVTGPALRERVAKESLRARDRVREQMTSASAALGMGTAEIPAREAAPHGKRSARHGASA